MTACNVCSMCLSLVCQVICMLRDVHGRFSMWKIVTIGIRYCTERSRLVENTVKGHVCGNFVRAAPDNKKEKMVDNRIETYGHRLLLSN